MESKAMQKRDGILVGQDLNLMRFTNGLASLKQRNGHFTSSILSNSACSNIENQLTKYLWTGAEEPPLPTGLDSCRDIRRFENSKHVTFKGEKLRQSGASEPESVPTLSSFKNNFINDITKEIVGYFPSADLELFNVFDPNNWPKKEGLINTYGLQEISQLCNIFEIENALETSQEWTEIITEIKEDSSLWCTVKDSKVVAFWRNILKKFNVGENIKLLIETVLVLPIGSADAERSFSLMNHIRTKRRSRLSDEATEALLRIRFNGPDELEKFNPIKYTKKWIETGHGRSEGGSSTVSKQKTLKEEEETVKNYLSGSSLF
jgi:hypothetical protein